MFFVKWPKTINTDFRADYLTETGEAIQGEPMESSDDLDYMMGTDRATQAQLDNLKITHSSMTFTQNEEPAGWDRKIDPAGIGP